MQVRELIKELIKFDSDTEVYLYVWNTEEKKAKSVQLSDIQMSRMGWGGIYLLGPNWPECMVGGHDEGCLCNLGFTPRWRKEIQREQERN